jgi:hypothetical protein
MCYIYAYIRDDSTPYYIGKGTGPRAWVKHRNVAIPDDIDKIIIMEKNLTEVGAFALERRYIRWYGKLCDRTGILENKTDGGEGHADGFRHSDATKQIIREKRALQKIEKMSEETKKKIGLSNKGMIHTPETREKFSRAKKGKKLPETHRENISKALFGNKRRLGTKHSPETLLKKRESMLKYWNEKRLLDAYK